MIHVLAVCLIYLAGVKAQSIACSEDAQCPSGFYCETDMHFCRKCLICDDLKRKPPRTGTTCIKSVVECGSCFEGLVEDHRNDLNAECVLSNVQNETVIKNPLTYIVATGIVIFFVLIIGVVIYVYRKKDLKILASMHTRVGSSCVRNEVPPNTQESPPPYNAHYTSVRPVSPFEPASAHAPAAAPAHALSPSHAPAPTPAPAPAPAPASAPAPALASAPELMTQFPRNPDAHLYDEESRPFIKRVPWPREQGARESASSQAARISNPPAYVRLPPTLDDSSLPAYGVADGPLVADDSPFVVHDEDTMESTWTPDNNNASNDLNANNTSIVPNGTTVHDLGSNVEGATGGTLLSMLSDARVAAQPQPHQHQHQHQHQQPQTQPHSHPHAHPRPLQQRPDHGPPAKIFCIRQEPNGNGETAESSHNRNNRDPSRNMSESNDLSVTISVVNNISTNQQFNNLTL